jgi:hypothetical protein
VHVILFGKIETAYFYISGTLNGSQSLFGRFAFWTTHFLCIFFFLFRRSLLIRLSHDQDSGTVSRTDSFCARSRAPTHQHMEEGFSVTFVPQPLRDK